MPSMNPYLNFQGNTEDAMNFYKSVFGGEFTTFGRFGDMPGGDKMPANEQNKILHAALPIGKNTVLMATDALESMGQKLIFGNNYHIAIAVDSEAEADKLFAGLSAGGKIEMPLNKTFWGAYFGMCLDKFGVSWMINYDYPKKP